MLQVKICGITNLDDALCACELGADAIGFIFYEGSPRFIDMRAAISIARRLPSHLARVGVFVDADVAEVWAHIYNIGLDAVQLHGTYPTREVVCYGEKRTIIAFQTDPHFSPELLRRHRNRAAAFLIDGYKTGLAGGTGVTADWQQAIAAKAYGKIILAGGLTPENVKEAVKTVRPYAIDVNSGVEMQVGRKDREKLEMLFDNVKEFRRDRQYDKTKRFPLA